MDHSVLQPSVLMVFGMPISRPCPTPEDRIWVCCCDIQRIPFPSVVKGRAYPVGLACSGTTLVLSTRHMSAIDPSSPTWRPNAEGRPKTACVCSRDGTRSVGGSAREASPTYVVWTSIFRLHPDFSLHCVLLLSAYIRHTRTYHVAFRVPCKCSRGFVVCFPRQVRGSGPRCCFDYCRLVFRSEGTYRTCFLFFRDERRERFSSRSFLIAARGGIPLALRESHSAVAAPLVEPRSISNPSVFGLPFRRARSLCFMFQAKKSSCSISYMAFISQTLGGPAAAEHVCEQKLVATSSVPFLLLTTVFSTHSSTIALSMLLRQKQTFPIRVLLSQVLSKSVLYQARLFV